MSSVADGIEIPVTGAVFSWRGPAPHHFVAVPFEESALLKELAAGISYGWGMIPVTARIGGTVFTTALFPKDGRYLIPLKDAVRAAEGIGVDDTVTIEVSVPAPG